jgi:hypothetical protein
MRHPALQSLPRIILFAGISLLTGLALYVSESGLVAVDPTILWLDSLIHALVCAILTFFLWYVVQFADLSNSLPLQRFLNNAALLLLSLTAWIGIPLLIQSIFWEDVAPIMNKGLALKVVFGFQLILLQLVTLRYLKKDTVKTGEEEEDVDEVEIDSDLPISQQKSIPESIGVSPSNGTENTPVHRDSITTISVKTGQKIQMIPIRDVLYLQAEGDYVLIQTVDGRHLKEQTMKFYEENLPSELFVRIHRSCIVHTAFISRIELYEKQNYRITLKTGHQLKASQTGYRLLKSTLAL